MAGSVASEQAIARVIHFAAFDAQAMNELIGLEIEATPNPWTISMLKGSLAAKSDCRKICEGVETIGYYVVQRILDEAEILNIVIFKSFQARGYGYSAIRKLQAELARTGIEKIFLEVRESNFAARALYAKTGFTLLGARKAYYRARNPDEQAEDAQILSCDLNVPHATPTDD